MPPSSPTPPCWRCVTTSSPERWPVPSATPSPSDRCSTRCAGIRPVAPRWSWPCSTPSCAPPVARWHRGSARPPPPSQVGAAVGLHDDIDDVLAEADAALAAGAVRIRVKIAPGRAAEPVRALRAHVGPDVILQADANGSFTEDDRELDLRRRRRARVPRATAPTRGPARPRAPRGAAAHPDLPRRTAHVPRCDRGVHRARRLRGRVPQARPGRRLDRRARGARSLRGARGAGVGGRDARDRCGPRREPGRRGPPHLALPPDLDPRGRFDPDLADPRRPVDGLVEVPTGPGTGAAPAEEALAVRRGRGSLDACERARRLHRRRPRRRRAHRGRGGAHTQRSVAHALGGARHGDRREVRELPVHRGLQGAWCPQQAPHR